MPLTAKHLLLYDGECGLCQRSVWWVARRDPRGEFAFASQSSAKARALMSGLGIASVDALVLVLNFQTTQPQVFIGPKAVEETLKHLQGLWPLGGILLSLFPQFLTMEVYRQIARFRKKIIPANRCPMHSPESTAWIRSRFLE
jgi:predicted DCC family thiol-disulfide oxidoreductase YuxK